MEATGDEPNHDRCCSEREQALPYPTNLGAASGAGPERIGEGRGICAPALKLRMRLLKIPGKDFRVGSRDPMDGPIMGTLQIFISRCGFLCGPISPWGYL